MQGTTGGTLLSLNSPNFIYHYSNCNLLSLICCRHLSPINQCILYRYLVIFDYNSNWEWSKPHELYELIENKVYSRPDDHQCWGVCGTCTAMHGLVASSISVFTAHKLAMNTCSYSPVVCKWCWHYCEHFHMCWQQRTNQVGYSTGGQRFMAVVNKPRLWATSLDSVCLLPGAVLQLN